MHWTASCQVVQAFTFYHLGARKGGGGGKYKGPFSPWGGGLFATFVSQYHFIGGFFLHVRSFFVLLRRHFWA